MLISGNITYNCIAKLYQKHLDAVVLTSIVLPSELLQQLPPALGHFNGWNQQGVYAPCPNSRWRQLDQLWRTFKLSVSNVISLRD